MTYLDLIEEYKSIRNKLSQLSGTEHEAAMARLIEIDNTLKEIERSTPRWTGGSTNYKPVTPSEPQKYTRKEVIVWTGIGVCIGMLISALIIILCK